MVDIFPPPELILCFLYIPNPAGLTWKFWIICFPLDIYQILGEYIEYCNVCWYSRIPSQTSPSSAKIWVFFRCFFCKKKKGKYFMRISAGMGTGSQPLSGRYNPKYLNIIISSFEISLIGISVGMSTWSQPLSGRWDPKISFSQYQNILDQNILDKKILFQYPNILDQNLLDQNISDLHQNICWDGNTGSQPLSVRWSLLLQPGFAIIHFSKSYLENHIDAH